MYILHALYLNNESVGEMSANFFVESVEFSNLREPFVKFSV